MRNIEEKIQISVSIYLKLQYPTVIFTSEGSGIRVTKGVAGKMKAQRSNHKLPDMIILKPRGKYYGLILELKKNDNAYLTVKGKVRDNKHIKAQQKTLLLLREEGYYADFAGGFDNARRIIDYYMGL